MTVRTLPPIERIARLDRTTLAEIILRRTDLRPQPVCYACAQCVTPLAVYQGRILCPDDTALARLGRL